MTVAAVGAVALLLAQPHAGAAPTNLARNSDFVRSFSGAGAADGWTAVRTPAGGLNRREPSGGVGGGACHRVVVPEDAPVEWYVASTVIRGLEPGAHATISASVRTAGLTGGHGAYIGVNYFDSTGTRINWTDSARSLTGDSPWVRLAQPFVVPAGTARIEANLVVQGRGTAWFDRVQVERGDSATPWAPREPAGAAAGRSGERIAILHDNLPASGTPSSPAKIAAMARAAGYTTEFLSADALADPALLRAGRIRALILPYGGAFPVAAADNLTAFLEDGGSLISVGGYPFDRLMVRGNRGWMPAADSPPDLTRLRPLIDPGGDPGAWTTGGRGVTDAPATGVQEAGRQAVRFGTPEMRDGGWCTLGSPALRGLPADTRRLVFYGRSEGGELPMAMEIVEADGARWRAKVTLTPKWSAHEIDTGGLEYWKDNPSKGRGGSGDRLRLADAVAIRFGITTEFVKSRFAYAAHIGPILTGATPPSRLRTVRLNSAAGGVNPATFLVTEPGAISICDASAPLSDVARIESAPDVDDLAGLRTTVQGVRGWSATGQTAQGDPGAPLKARWAPLAMAVDRYGRIRGTAMAAMWNFAGAYPGSAWVYSGLTGRDLLDPASREAPRLLRAALARVTRGAFIYNLQADPPCARPGEVITLRASLGSLAGAARRASLRVAATCAGVRVASLERTVDLPAHGSASLSWSLAAPRTSASGLLRFRVTLDAPGAPRDTLECGSALWSPERQARGTKLRLRNGALDFGRGPEFGMGSQLYWGNATITGTDPLRWAGQLRAMADAGIRVARAFTNVPGGETEAAWRSRDALVQLAQESGIALFYEGLSWPVMDPAENLRRSAPTRTAAERYRAAPGWFIDVRNEPVITMDGPGPWDHEAMSQVMRGWARSTMEAAHSIDPGRLVSVGYLQGFGSGAVAFDAIEGSRDLDFTNRHYYGALQSYARELKQVDLRLTGRAPSTGEFGATSHPGLRQHAVYETEREAAWRYAYVAHACFGMGGLFCANWHWQDPIEDIFPCGALLSDGARRDRFQPYRNAGALLRTIRLRPQLPRVWVVIPRDRFGANAAPAEDAMNRAIDALLGLHVEFAAVPEDDMARLPAGAVVVRPVGAVGIDQVDGQWTLGLMDAPKLPTPLREVVSRFLQRAGVSRHAVLPDLPVLQSFRVPGQAGAVAQVLLNTGSASLHVTISDLPAPVAIDLPGFSCGAVVFDGRGRVLAAEGARVAVGGCTVLEADASAGLITLDGSDLRAARSALLLPGGPGRAYAGPALAAGRVSVGEMRDGRWREYEEPALDGRGLCLDRAMARSWVLLGRRTPAAERRLQELGAPATVR